MSKQAIPLVVKIVGKSATTFAGVDYNEKKVAERHAFRAATYNCGKIGEKDIHSVRVINKYLQKIADKNDGVLKPQKHIIFSMPGKPTQAEIDEAVKQVHQTLDMLGYRGQPQLLYVHNDTGHVHIHAVTVTVNRETGQWISNAYEGVNAKKYIDELRGISHQSNLDKLTGYSFESRQQFMNLLWNNGYKFARIDEENGKIIIPVMSYAKTVTDSYLMDIDLEDVDRMAEENGKNKDKYERRVKQLRAILMDYRRESMDYVVDTPPGKDKHRDGQEVVTRTQQLNQLLYGKFKGSKYIDMNDLRKQQLKLLLQKLKSDLGIQVVFNEWKDGQVKGYTIIDHTGGKKGDERQGIVFKGSDILPLQQFLDPEWKRGKETDTVISAKEAAEAAKELNPQNYGHADGIAQILEIHGVKFNIDEIDREYFDYMKEENIEKALAFAKLVPIVRDEFGMEEAERYARMAYSHACAADLQESMGKVSVNKPAPSRPTKPAQQVNAPGDVAAVKPDGRAQQSNGERPQQPYASSPETPEDGQGQENGNQQEGSTDEQPLAFVDLHAEIKDGRIISVIDDEEYSSDLRPMHQSWYDQQENKRFAANALAMHYFPEQIYEAQMYNYRQFFLQRDEMPQEIKVENPHAIRIYNGDVELHSTFIFRNKEKQRVYKKISNAEQMALKHSKTTERQMAVRKFGKTVLTNPSAQPKPFSEVKAQEPEYTNAPFHMPEAINETLKVFEGVAETLAASVHAAFGFVIGTGASPAVGGGGGGPTGGWRGRKDPEDWKRYDLFGNPSGKKKQIKIGS